MSKKNKITIISDLHLGLNNSKPKNILNFLNSIETEVLILNGDIIDIDAINRGHKWKNKHNKVIIKLLDMSKKTKVVYIRGNHDDDIKKLFNTKIGNIEFVDEFYVYVEDGENEKKYVVTHGDKLENPNNKLKIFYKVGSVLYDVLLSINNYYNIIREYFKLPYHSISKMAKTNVKKIMSFIFEFEVKALEFAIKTNSDGVICGHIHTPTIKKIGDIEYMNSGDWVENQTAIVLDSNNHWVLVDLSL
jgi:UDP-2,3-diacylglucosamine pyrophosphatase LpxH